MPFKSEAQRRYLWMHEPAIAKKWSHKYGSKPIPTNRSRIKSAAASRVRSQSKSTTPVGTRK